MNVLVNIKLITLTIYDTTKTNPMAKEKTREVALSPPALSKMETCMDVFAVTTPEKVKITTTTGTTRPIVVRVLLLTK